MLICARDSIWKTPTVSARQIMSKVAVSFGGMSCIEMRLPRKRSIRSKQRRSAVSMPSASTSTFSSPKDSRSSLSHWITVRSAMAAFSIGTSVLSGSPEITKPPTCCDRWRGKPISSRTSCASSGQPRRLDADPAAVERLLAAARATPTTSASASARSMSSSPMPSARATSRIALRVR